jgi:hypothetical protein
MNSLYSTRSKKRTLNIGPHTLALAAEIHEILNIRNMWTIQYALDYLPDGAKREFWEAVKLSIPAFSKVGSHMTEEELLQLHFSDVLSILSHKQSLPILRVLDWLLVEHILSPAKEKMREMLKSE